MLRDARERYDVPVVEVIRPAVRRAVAATRNDQVGVICTRATHQSHAYDDSFAAAPQITVTSRPCPRFVEFVESGVTVGPELLGAAHEYLEPIAAQGVDTLILGCTHYPLLTGVISYVMGDDVTLVTSAEETAKDVYRVLADARRAAPRRPAAAQPRFVTTGDPAAFAGSDAGSSAPRWCRPPRDRGQPMRLTVVGCSGSLAGPGSPASCYLVERPSTRAAPGGSCSTSATARWGRCSGTSTSATSTRCCSATCTPTTAWTCAACTSPSGTTRAAPTRGPMPVHGPAGIAGRLARAYDLDDGEPWAPSWTSVRCRTRAAFEIGPFRVTPFLVNHPVEAYGLRVEAGGRTAGLHRRHRQLRGAAARCATTPTLVLADSAFVDGRDAVEGIHLSGRRAAQGGRGRRGSPAAGAHPPAAVERPARSAGPRPARSGPARSSWPLPTRPTSCSPAPGAGGHHLTLGA